MMADAWRRQEPREVRPFFSSIQAQDALLETGIRLYENGDVTTESTFELDEIDFKKLAPVVSVVVANPKTWLSDGLTTQDLNLVLIARHGFLKRSKIINQVSLSKIKTTEWEVGPESLAALGGGRNIQITLALCLANDRAPKPGSAFVPGHWLAKKTFIVRSRTMPTLFDLRTRSDEEWVAAGYPAKTFYAVDYLGGLDQELEEGASVATVWVHTDAHNKMATSNLGETMQPLLASEIISTIVLESFKDWKDSAEADPASPLATLLKQFGGDTPLPLSELKALASKPSKLRATLQDRLSVLSALK
jgi:hypothetical protein